MYVKIVSICFVGFGNAARRLAEILLQFSDEIYRRYSIKIRCSAISTARHSSVVSRRANKIDLEHALNLVKAGKQLTELENVEEVESAIQAIAKSGADIVIETTTLNPYDGEPALSHVAFALKSRKHVVSANKGPVAYALPYLKTLAKEQKVSFRYESTVMDGAPIFNLVEQCLPLVKVDSIFGIVNSTTNFILSQMELGVDFGNALSEAQKMGIAEADPSFDLDGWDAAVKLSVLANSIMQAELRPSQVSRVSISSLNRRSLRENYKRGFKTRVIA
ncbi:MAG: homoserine dehydrogenase, partial [Blastocatellia bacterium]|nr:homoserine dehydrogenase [Blastocatellia bacterium]